MKKWFLLLVMAFACGSFTASAANQVVDKLVWYIPNRLMDALDIFTVNVGTGPTVRCELMATEYVHGGGGIGVAGKLYKAYNRQYGYGVENGWNWNLITVGAENSERAKTSLWVVPYQQSFAGVPDPDQKIYDFYTGARDFWRLGGSLGLGIEGDLYLHPAEIADFVTGVFMIDLKGDDYSSDDIN